MNCGLSLIKSVARAAVAPIGQRRDGFLGSWIRQNSGNPRGNDLKSGDISYDVARHYFLVILRVVLRSAWSVVGLASEVLSWAG